MPDCPDCEGTGIGYTPDSNCEFCNGTGTTKRVKPEPEAEKD